MNNSIRATIKKEGTSMDESNTAASAYTLYIHWYCSNHRHVKIGVTLVLPDSCTKRLQLAKT